MSSGPVDVRQRLHDDAADDHRHFFCLHPVHVMFHRYREGRERFMVVQRHKQRQIRGVDHISYDGDYCPALKYSPSIVYM